MKALSMKAYLLMHVTICFHSSSNLSFSDIPGEYIQLSICHYVSLLLLFILQGPEVPTVASTVTWAPNCDPCSLLNTTLTPSTKTECTPNLTLEDKVSSNVKEVNMGAEGSVVPVWK